MRILVVDSGNGIPLDQWEKVFNEFETVGHVSQHYKGTGLGMPISRKLALGMGGDLQFTSRVGSGSTFWVEITKEKILGEALYHPRPDTFGPSAA